MFSNMAIFSSLFLNLLSFYSFASLLALFNSLLSVRLAKLLCILLVMYMIFYESFRPLPYFSNG